jgi:hypothetical protein
VTTNWFDQVSIIDVWERLGGGPVHDGHGVAWWRGDDSPNISIESNLNVWFDHVSNSGGRVSRLVRTVLGCDQQTALQWLREQRFDGVPAQLASVEQQAANKRAGLRQMAEEICLWRLGRIWDLEEWGYDVERDFWKRRISPEQHFSQLDDLSCELSLLKTNPKAVVDAFRRSTYSGILRAALEIKPGQEGEEDFMAGILCLLSCDPSYKIDRGARRGLESPCSMTNPSPSRSPASEPGNKGPKPKRVQRDYLFLATRDDTQDGEA